MLRWRPMLLLSLFLLSVREKSLILSPKGTHTRSQRKYENCERRFKRHSRRRKRIKPNCPRCDVTRVSRPRFRWLHFQSTTLLTEALNLKRRVNQQFSNKVNRSIGCLLVDFFLLERLTDSIDYNTVHIEVVTSMLSFICPQTGSDIYVGTKVRYQIEPHATKKLLSSPSRAQC